MKVYGKKSGGDLQTFTVPEGATVNDLRTLLGLDSTYAAQDGSKEPVDGDTELGEDSFYVFSANVKGGSY